MSLTDLHTQLDAIVSTDNKNRSLTRILGHALIELGIITKIECMYDECVFETREFLPSDVAKRREVPIIDHIVERWQGGDDLPSNLQLIHFACNSRKTMRIRLAVPEIKEALTQKVRDRWQDPEFRKRTSERLAAAGSSPETAAKRSASMKKHWQDPERRAAHTARLLRGDDWQRSREDSN